MIRMPATDFTFTETPDPAVAKAWFSGLTHEHPQALECDRDIAEVGESGPYAW